MRHALGTCERELIPPSSRSNMDGTQPLAAIPLLSVKRGREQRGQGGSRAMLLRICKYHDHLVDDPSTLLWCASHHSAVKRDTVSLCSRRRTLLLVLVPPVFLTLSSLKRCTLSWEREL